MSVDRAKELLRRMINTMDNPGVRVAKKVLGELEAAESKPGPTEFVSERNYIKRYIAKAQYRITTKSIDEEADKFVEWLLKAYDRIESQAKQIVEIQDNNEGHIAMIEQLGAELADLRSQQPPCSQTCYHHQTHPCEQCGRINGYSPLVWNVEQLATKDKEIKQLGIGLRQTQIWAKAYSLDVFPKPDLKKAAEVLKANGMALDAISADAMRHVLDGVKNIVEQALKDDKPEIPENSDE